MFGPQNSKPRSKRGRKPRMKAKVRQAYLQSDDVANRAAWHGLKVNVHEVKCGPALTHHWQFRADQGNRLVLDYWPGTGRWHCRQTGESGKAGDVWEALEVAVKCSVLG